MKNELKKAVPHMSIKVKTVFKLRALKFSEFTTRHILTDILNYILWSIEN